MIYLREFDKEKDLEDYFRFEKSRNIAGKLFETVFEYMMAEMEEKMILRYVIIHKSTGKTCGFCQLDMEENNAPEIGIDLFEEEQGKGYGSKAAEMLIDLASKWDNIEYFKWNARKDNQRSRRIAEKLGGVYIGEKPLYSKSFIEYAIEGGVFKKDEIPYVCKYQIPKAYVKMEK